LGLKKQLLAIEILSAVLDTWTGTCPIYFQLRPFIREVGTRLSILTYKRGGRSAKPEEIRGQLQENA
jgi:hypothetical protein